MNVFFYCIIFIIGILFGSFYTLAIHRIPRKQDIIHTHSYCPNCNNKLGFLELIPVFSYLALGGKCKHCKEKINIRYLLIELLSGSVFVLFAASLGLDAYNLNRADLAFFAFMALYTSFIFITAGIDKANRKIEKGVTYFGVAISLAYIIYLYIVGQASIYRYVMYIVAFLILLIFDSITLKKYAKNSYINGILMLVVIMAVFTGEFVTISTIGITLFAIAIYLLINKIRQLKRKNVKQEKILNSKISIAFYLSCINIIILIPVIWLCSIYAL